MLPPPTRTRYLVPILLISAMILTLVGVFIAVSGSDGDGGQPRKGRSAPRFDYPMLDVVPGTAVPYAGPVTGDWSARVVTKTDIPERMLRAYVAAEERVRTATPGCKLSWAVLAGVGRIESRHGRFGGATIKDDGTITPRIIGLPLDGSPGVRAVRDTDGGRLDGDTTWDRAVGPMQFLPTTWKKYGARASGDGAGPDPQNIDDAALTAALYLCASGGDLATGRGWWKAVLTYNESTAYAKDVFSAADAYGRVAAA